MEEHIRRVYGFRIGHIIAYVLDFHERRKLKSRLFSWPAIAVLLALTIPLGFSVFERYEKERETATKRAERAQELAEHQVRAAALEAKVAYIESERGIEEEIRERYDAVREGERAVVVMAAPAAKAVATSSVSEPMESSFFSWLFFWR